MPNEMGEVIGLWESHFKNAFLGGLLPSIREEVMKTCIGVVDARLTEIVRHAKHVEKVILLISTKKSQET